MAVDPEFVTAHPRMCAMPLPTISGMPDRVTPDDHLHERSSAWSRTGKPADDRRVKVVGLLFRRPLLVPPAPLLLVGECARWAGWLVQTPNTRTADPCGKTAVPVPLGHTLLVGEPVQHIQARPIGPVARSFVPHRREPALMTVIRRHTRDRPVVEVAEPQHPHAMKLGKTRQDPQRVHSATS